MNQPTSSPTPMSSSFDRHDWPMLTNHGHVLLCIASEGDVRISDIARLTGIGERATYRIVGDLVRAGYVSRQRMGRRNSYSINSAERLRHPLEIRFSVNDLVRPHLESQ